MANGHGGRRPGAGRKKGTNGLDREMARARLRERVIARMDDLLDSQLDNACGIKYLVARERKTGRFVEVSQDQVKLILSGKDDTFEMLEVYEKQPSVQAFTDLMNRTLDKPKEHVEVDGNLSGGISITWKTSE